MKKERLILLITKEKYFGDVSAHVHVVEFQTRSLPHVHILVNLKDGYKLTTVNDIEKFIPAEIPDLEIDPVLYNIEIHNIIHSPCHSRCIVEGKFSKHYPKEFCEETVMSYDGYSYYRRRNNSRSIVRHNQTVDNRFVVPHCPQLLRIFNCHINVEMVSSVRSVKYLYKYIYKGHDAANEAIEDVNNKAIINQDKIRNYIET